MSDEDDEESFDWKKQLENRKSKKKKKKKKKDAEQEEQVSSNVPEEFDDDGFGGAIQHQEEEEEEDNSDLPDWKKLLVDSIPNRKPYIRKNWEDGNDTQALPYTVALTRIFNKLNAGRRKEHVVARLPLPDVCPYGGRRCIFNNFPEIIKILKREKEHVQAFYLAELACDGNFDARDRLIMRGRFRQNQLKSLLKKYIAEYVSCINCRCLDTELNREASTRLFILICQRCGATRSVKPIKTGFQAEDRRTRRHKRYAVKQ